MNTFVTNNAEIVAMKKLQAFLVYLEEGLDSLKKTYPEFLAFVLENKDKTYREMKKELLKSSQ